MAGERLVLLNYHIDPARFAKLEPQLAARFGPSGYRVVAELEDGDAARVRVLVNKTRELTAERLRPFRSLRAVLVWATDPWMISLDGARPTVRTLPFERGTDVAELAVLLALLALKRVTVPHPWRRWSLRQIYQQLFPVVASETAGAHNFLERQTATLCGKRVGIAGYGLIGRQIHRRLEGFGCEVSYYHRTPFSPGLEARLRLVHRDIAELLAESDVVFLQLPLTNETCGLIDAKRLAGARAGLVLVNCGRAAVVDKQALYRALRSGQVGFYAADVFWQEPMPLWDRYRLLPNSFFTPHLAESVPGAPDIQQIMFDELKKLIEDIDA